MNKPIGEIVNAQIKSTFLGREEHGSFIASLYLGYSNSSQAFGRYPLGSLTANDEFTRNQSCKFGIKFLLQILNISGVEDWEHLVGAKLRVDKEGWGEIYGIGHYLKDKWLYPAELVEEFFPKD